VIKLLLLFLKGAKLGKILLSAGTMAISVIVYAWVFGWRYAVGFVGLIFCHEMGHYAAARLRGLNVGAPTFIPFVGAWIELKDQPMNAETEAYVGLAGPLAGSFAALAVYALARYTGEVWLLALAYSGFFLNLFNLIPLSPFDGGRVTAVLSPKLWLIGAPILIGLFLYHPSPLLIMMALLAWPQLMKVWRGETNANTAYYIADMETKLSYGLAYLGLAGFLAVMCSELHEQIGAR
jgi:Zn-dependent protease